MKAKRNWFQFVSWITPHHMLFCCTNKSISMLFATQFNKMLSKIKVFSLLFVIYMYSCCSQTNTYTQTLTCVKPNEGWKRKRKQRKKVVAKREKRVSFNPLGQVLCKHCIRYHASYIRHPTYSTFALCSESVLCVCIQLYNRSVYLQVCNGPAWKCEWKVLLNSTAETPLCR